MKLEINNMDNSTFQIICKNCGSKLTAKASLIGQTRNCPKCKTPILIQRDEPITPSVPNVSSPSLSTPIIVNEPSIEPVQTGPSIGEGVGRIENLPERLAFRNRYFILGHDRIVAAWETGKGWQINVGSGFSPAKKNIQAIPDQGTFQLVELVISSKNDETTIGGVPTSVNVFKISVRGALTALYRDESEILNRVECVGELSNLQKSLLLGHLRQIFMFDTLAGAGDLMAVLSTE